MLRDLSESSRLLFGPSQFSVTFAALKKLKMNENLSKIFILNFSDSDYCSSTLLIVIFSVDLTLSFGYTFIEFHSKLS